MQEEGFELVSSSRDSVRGRSGIPGVAPPSRRPRRTARCYADDVDQSPVKQPAPATLGLPDLAREPGRLASVVRSAPESLLGRFWRIAAIPEEDGHRCDGHGLVSCLAFLTDLEVPPAPSVCRFRFFTVPGASVLTVKSVSNVYSMVELAEPDAEPLRRLRFRLALLFRANDCSPLVLPGIFEEIRRLDRPGADGPDWQLLSTAPLGDGSSHPSWAAVRAFCQEMAASSRDR